MKRKPSYLVALKRLEKLKEKTINKDRAIKYALNYITTGIFNPYMPGMKSTKEVLRKALK